MAVTQPRTLDDLPHGGFGVDPSGGRKSGGRGGPKRKKHESMATWRWGDRDRLRDVLGRRPGAVRDRRGDRRLHGVQGRAVPQALAAVVAPVRRGRPVAVRRLPGPDPRHDPADAHRHRDRHADRGRRRDLGRRVRPPGAAGARGRVRHRGRRRHARHRPGDLRPGALPARAVRLDVVHRGGRRGLRPLVPDRGRDDVADRAADGLRRDARGPAVDPAPRARGVLRAGQDEDRDDPARAAARGAAEHLDRRRARHGPHRGGHGDRRDPARRDAAPGVARARSRASTCSRAPGRR